MSDDHQARCVLCGTPVGLDLGRGPPSDPRFCCIGCEQVSEILAAAPPEQGRRILDQARRLGLVPDPDGVLGVEPAPEPPPLPEVPASALAVERFSIGGMYCPSCAWLVSALLDGHPGVIEADADFLSDSVRVRFDMRQTSPEELDAVVARSGYALRPLEHPESKATSALLARSLFAAFLFLNLMMLSVVHYADFVDWMPRVDQARIAVFQLILVLPLAWLGLSPLVARSVRLLKLGRASMDLLFVLGFSAAFALSLLAFVHEESDFYFDACGAFVAISLAGRFIEGRLRLKAARELRLLLQLSATKARVLGEEDYAYLPLESVEAGQIVEVATDQYVPFDGECLTEGAVVSEAMLTGEPTPIPKGEGEAIWAGSSVVGGALRVRVIRPYREGRLQQIAAAMSESMHSSELRLRSADRVASWFVPLVVALAVVTFAVRLAWFGDPLSAEVWLPGISVLLIACPCAFGIATASALAGATAALLHRGILVRDGSALERLAEVDLLALDKTGTLTLGDWRIQGVEWVDEPDDEVLAAVAGAERDQEHPAAHALRTWLVREQGIAPSTPDQVGAVPGLGLQARFGERILRVGSPALFDVPIGLEPVPDHVSVVAFGWDRPIGRFLAEDTVRPGSAEVIARLRELGVEPIVLSGDRQQVVSSVAATLGIDEAMGELSPEGKRQRVEALQAAGRRVAFAGDGSNDGPALAASQVAIALRHATDLSLQSAHVVPLTGDLEVLPSIWGAARRTTRTIRLNFWWAWLFNGVFLPVAALGLLHPILAAGLMFASSITVLLHSARLQRVLGRMST